MFIKFKYIDNKYLLDCDGKEINLQDSDTAATCLEDGRIIYANEADDNYYPEYNGKLFAQLLNEEISIFQWGDEDSFIVVSDELLRRGFHFSMRHVLVTAFLRTVDKPNHVEMVCLVNYDKWMPGIPEEAFEFLIPHEKFSQLGVVFDFDSVSCVPRLSVGNLEQITRYTTKFVLRVNTAESIGYFIEVEGRNIEYIKIRILPTEE